MALTKSRNRMHKGAARSIADYQVALDGTTDDTGAWNQALADGGTILFPEAQSKITGMLVFPAETGTFIEGVSRHKSQFLIDHASFDMEADAVVQLGTFYQGLKRVGFVFTQPSTAVRASIKEYPWVIDLNGHARAELHELLIEKAWIGIRAEGNCGGLIIDDIQIGCLLQGLLVDGALDSVRVNRWHYWPFGMANDTNLMQVYTDGNNQSLAFGRVDDLNISSILSFQSRISFADYGDGSPFGVGSNITMDGGYAQIDHLAGEMTLSTVYSSSTTADDYIIRCGGGELKIVGLAMETGVALTTYAAVRVSGALTRFICSDIMASSFGGRPAFECSVGAVMQLSNGYISDPTGTARADGIIHVAADGGRIGVTGLRAGDKPVGASGPFIKIDADDYHVVVNNSFEGWDYTYPAGGSSGVYGPNIGVGNQGATGDYVLPFRTRRLTVTLDGSGDGVVAHGLLNAHTRLQSVSGHHTGAGVERVAIAGITVDGTNVNLAAGAPGAGKAAVVWLTYL